jgi:beta-lactamase regulating signal transducer with metallopeptidase domain
MANELIDLLVRINLALAAGIVLALALRMPARRYFGARAAYALWLAPVAAAAMCFAPARIEHIVIDASIAALAPANTAAQPPYLLWAWAAGAALSLVILVLRQARFTQALGRLHARADLGARVRAAESAVHGPAVIGVLRPIIVTPADFEARFDAEEQRIVLAHERAHLAQGDPWINAFVVLIQCVNWFNPFVHIGARALRIDQELACDAAVLAQAEGLRRRYAETILKTHIAQAAPIGCAWPPTALNDIKERIAMLKRTLPSRAQRLAGASAIALVTVSVAAAAWAAQPTRIVATVAAAPVVAGAHASALTQDGEAELEGGRTHRRIVGHGDHDRELTPEERAELEAALEEMHEAMADMHVEIEAAMAARHAAMAEIDHEAIARSVHEAIDAANIAGASRMASLEAMAEVDAELADMRIELANMPDVEAEVREAMRLVEVEMAREMPRIRAEVRASLREAEAEVAREREVVRARGESTRDHDRALRDLREAREREERD